MQFNSFEIQLLEQSADLLRAMTHPLRISLINFIMENQPVKVYDIHSRLELDQSITSQHLRILRESGIVKILKDGKNVYYEVDSPRIRTAARAILNFDDQTLKSRKRRGD